MAFLRSIKDHALKFRNSLMFRNYYVPSKKMKEKEAELQKWKLASQCNTCFFRYGSHDGRCSAGIEVCNPRMYPHDSNLVMQPKNKGNCSSYLQDNIEKSIPYNHFVVIRFTEDDIVESVTPLNKHGQYEHMWIVDTRKQLLPIVGAKATFGNGKRRDSIHAKLRWRETKNKYTDVLGRTRHAKAIFVAPYELKLR